jgi:hypothetical protein
MSDAADRIKQAAPRDRRAEARAASGVIVESLKALRKVLKPIPFTLRAALPAGSGAAE